jgi:hemoglobin-like flavoprotein
MTPEQKDILRDTWRSIVPIADHVAELFYDRLFEIDPGARSLFTRAAMPGQRRSLMFSLSLFIHGVDQLESLIPMIEALGRRHTGYGAIDAHYFSAGTAMLWALEQGLGDAWTPEAADAWSSAYVIVAAAMLEASKTGESHQGASVRAA